MQYKRLNVEVVVLADEGDEVVAELNAALDRLAEKHAIFGGEIASVGFEHSGTRRRSALGHTLAAGATAAAAVGAARNSVKNALRAVI